MNANGRLNKVPKVIPLPEKPVAKTCQPTLTAYRSSNSFITQGLHWMNTGGTAGGEPEGEERGGQKCHRDADEREGIGRFDFIEQPCQQVREAEGARYAENKTEGNQFHSVTQHELPRFLVRQRFQQHRVHDTENRRVRTDTGARASAPRRR